MNSETMEQKRARNVWQCCEHYEQRHVVIAKSLPALIMNSGLMQVLAFCEEKQGPHGKVAGDLRSWLTFSLTGDAQDPGYEPFMESLMKADPARFRFYSSEAFAWLRWMRQIAPARVRKQEAGGQ